MKVNNLESAMKNAKYSLEVEGLNVTPEMNQLVKDVLEGRITEAEFERQALAIAKQAKR
ncbi:antitoxin VbhA family protein [Halobacillus litoralis]|uniref:antitoxin VbhA family protein n=1 Tax=Halobacillus litoralis TaxID=45668 RepID=UPI001CFD5EE1|nr:antitoxin VbhA family protein [Halobacillus litoralis]